MIWNNAFSDHYFAIKGWVRSWLGMSLWSRMFWFAALIWMPANFFIAILASEIHQAFLLASPLVWLIFWFELICESGEHVVFAGNHAFSLMTKVHYLGGHPLLPHGRYVYLTLDGTRTRPTLTIHLTPSQRFSIPLLDFETAEQKREREELGIASIAFATLTQRSAGGVFQSAKSTLHVKYKDDAGREQVIEITDFMLGEGEIQNWRNFLICARAEAELEVTPLAPWASLPEERINNDKEDNADAEARTDSEEPVAGEAFARG